MVGFIIIVVLLKKSKLNSVFLVILWVAENAKQVEA